MMVRQVSSRGLPTRTSLDGTDKTNQYFSASKSVGNHTVLLLTYYNSSRADGETNSGRVTQGRRIVTHRERVESHPRK